MPLDFARLSPAELAPERRGDGDHFVQLYDSDETLVDAIATYIGVGLAHDEAAIVVATDDHRSALADALESRGFDLEALAAAERYFSLDAGHTLATFLLDGRPNEARFEGVIGGLIQRATGSGRNVRVFGEMVALLWDGGDVAGAIELEEMWNRLAERQLFDLFCAYPTGSFADEDLSLLTEVCHRHSHVIPPV
jgi:hypothetical protein